MKLQKGYGNDSETCRADASLYCKEGESIPEMLLRFKKEEMLAQVKINEEKRIREFEERKKGDKLWIVEQEK